MAPEPLPDAVRAVLPPATAEAWPVVAAVAPDDGVLMGGTALAVHLGHRVSRDLDVFTRSEFDPSAIAARLGERGRFAITTQGVGTLNGIFEDAKVQFLWARGQRDLEPPKEIAGLAVGSISDLLADRGDELRSERETPRKRRRHPRHHCEPSRLRRSGWPR